MSDGLERFEGALAACVIITIALICGFGGSCADHERREDLRACAEACGPAGMQSWNRFDGCVCQPLAEEIDPE